MKVFLYIFISTISLANCVDNYATVTNVHKKKQRIIKLLKKNKKLLNKYKDDTSKRLKINSNIFVLTNKYQTAKLRIEEICKIVKNKKCDGADDYCAIYMGEKK